MVEDEVKKIAIRGNASGILGFRLVGSRHSGVFVYSIQDEHKHQNGLEIGDRLLQCDKVPLQGRAPEQVASILRFSLNRSNHIFVIVKRENSIRETLEKARQRANKENELAERFEENDEDSDEPSSSWRGSSEDFSMREITPPSSFLSTSFHYDSQTSPMRIKRRMVKSFTTEDRVLLITCNADQEYRTLGLCEREDFEIDFSSGKFQCPICFKYTDLKKLHRLRHMWTLSARRFLPFSFSDYAIL
ncbi:unnamed protein product, partial [Mesorhabditis belari]|uniref:PDZ domain-containing protein n=1 Tax=Mesorhabditis belari TaxID=2138241 RepID=A0AAF3EKW8_9BILA